MSLAQLQKILDQHPDPNPTPAPRMTMGHIRKALGLPLAYKAEKRELAARTRAAAKTTPTTTTKPKTPRQARVEALVKSMTTPRAKPMTGDQLLTTAEKLLHAGKLDPATAQRIVTSVHLGRLPDAADLLKAACQ